MSYYPQRMGFYNPRFQRGRRGRDRSRGQSFFQRPRSRASSVGSNYSNRSSGSSRVSGGSRGKYKGVKYSDYEPYRLTRNGEPRFHRPNSSFVHHYEKKIEGVQFGKLLIPWSATYLSCDMRHNGENDGVVTVVLQYLVTKSGAGGLTQSMQNLNLGPQRREDGTRP